MGAGKRARRVYGVASATVLVAVALLLGSSHATAARGGSIEVLYRSQGAYELARSASAGSVLRAVPALRLLELRAADAPRLAARLRAQRGVAVARPAVERAAAGGPALTLGMVSTPAGGAYEWQWYATGMDRVPTAVLQAAARTTIAVVDTGVDVSVPTLAGKVAGARDVRTRRASVADATGHGTFVASLAAGRLDGDGGVAGFGGAARLLAVKVGNGTKLSDVDVAAGIVYAVDHGARIVNVSVAGHTRSPAEVSAVAYAARRGVLLVAAVGNEALDGNAVTYPAALLQPVGSNGAGGVGLAVGASDEQGVRAAFSEHGSFVSLVAPGAAVFGAIPSGMTGSFYSPVALQGVSRGAYSFASGTSYAAPQVAGVAALVWAANPALSARQVAEILELTAGGHGSWNEELGYGVLDAGAAVRAALQTRP